MDHAMNRMLEWLERKNFVSVHALTLYITLWMTWEAFAWAAQWAIALPAVDTGHATVIAAVTAPIAYLQKAAFEIYSNYRREAQ